MRTGTESNRKRLLERNDTDAEELRRANSVTMSLYTARPGAVGSVHKQTNLPEGAGKPPTYGNECRRCDRGRLDGDGDDQADEHRDVGTHAEPGAGQGYLLIKPSQSVTANRP